MTEVYLSEENIRRLRELQYGHAAEPVQLPPVAHGSRHRQTHSWRRREKAAAMHGAMAALKSVTDNKTLHDAALKVFACISMHFLPTTSHTPAQSQPDNDAVDDIGSSKESDGPADSCHDPDNLLEAQQSLVAALVSRTLCSRDSTDTSPGIFTSEVGLATLLLLQYTSEPADLSPCTLTRVAAYTDQRSDWTTKAAASFANRLLDPQMTRVDLISSVATVLASDIARPRLQQAPGSDPAESYVVHGAASTPSKCIENKRMFSTAFEWVLKGAQTEYVSGHWHLFVPVLIDLTESHEITAKKKALDLIILFVAKCPTTTLLSTGIDRLLENTMFPMLHLLPPLTPENESAILLATAYKALTDLAVKNPAVQDRSRRRLLDKLLRQGVLQSHRHTSEYVMVTTVLLQNTTRIISLLGILSIKHLSNILRFIESVMCGSISSEHPEVLMAASEALVFLIINCWPRMGTAQPLEQALYILGVCWFNLHESTAKDPRDHRLTDGKDMKLCLQEAARTMLLISKKTSESIAHRLEMICVQDNRLRGLFMN